jgi:hypothetical protein
MHVRQIETLPQNRYALRKTGRKFHGNAGFRRYLVVATLSGGKTSTEPKMRTELVAE